MNISIRIKRNQVLIALLLLAASCNKIAEAPPPADRYSTTTVYGSDSLVMAVLHGVYNDMAGNGSQFTSGNITVLTGLYSDELINSFPGIRDEFYQNQLTPSSHPMIDALTWSNCYKYIYTANDVLMNLSVSTSISNAVRRSVMGQAYFIRAFCYFHLVNLFGPVPLVLTTDPFITGAIPRSAIDVVYNAIRNDLQKSIELLENTGVVDDRNKPDQWAAKALLARIELYTANYSDALQISSELINNQRHTLATTVSSVFDRGSSETIWQIPSIMSNNTWESLAFSPVGNSKPPYVISPALYLAFEPGDPRINWIRKVMIGTESHVYPGKYGTQNSSASAQHYIVLRMGEQYLIRAESRLALGDVTGALQDVNQIRQRAGLPSLFITNPSLASAILRERRVELCFEWGHRWYDLKRSGTANAIMSIAKPLTWQSTDLLWPLPQQQLILNPNLLQNPGY